MYDIKEIKNSLSVHDVADIAESVGISTRLANGKYHIHCPGHAIRLGKEDKNDSSCVLTKTGYRCFACGESIDVFQMVQEATGCDFVHAVAYVAGQCGIGETAQQNFFPLSRREVEFLGLDYFKLKEQEEKAAILYTVLIAAEEKKEEIRRKQSLFCEKNGKGAPLVFDICQQGGFLDEEVQIKLYNSYKADISYVDSILEKLELQ